MAQLNDANLRSSGFMSERLKQKIDREEIKVKGVNSKAQRGC